MNLWSGLIPLILGSAIVPIQLIVTILLLRSSSGRITSVAFVAGMVSIRLLQGIVFGLILSSDSTSPEADGATSPVTGALLLVVGVLMLVLAGRSLLNEPDPDSPPPKWLAMTASIKPAKAYLLGAGLIGIGAKFWVFTLSAIGVIGDAGLSRASSIATFLLFVVLCSSAMMALIAVSVLAPSRSDALLTSASDWLGAHNRVIVIALGLVFGVWFVAKGLTGLGVL